MEKDITWHRAHVYPNLGLAVCGSRRWKVHVSRHQAEAGKSRQVDARCLTLRERQTGRGRRSAPTFAINERILISTLHGFYTCRGGSLEHQARITLLGQEYYIQMYAWEQIWFELVFRNNLYEFTDLRSYCYSEFDSTLIDFPFE